jgi:lipoprotein signal peptidase
MTFRAAVSTVTAPASVDDAAFGAHRRQRLIAVGLVLAVVVVDQATKWWGWRHAPDTFINSGSTWPTGAPMSAWFSGKVSGRLLDLGAVGLFTVAGILLARRRRRGLVLVAGFLILGGWTSNLLDRLGLHALTAPGSSRGAVDFIHLGTPYSNVADYIIVGATTVLGLSACAATGRKLRAATSRRAEGLTLRRPRVPVRVYAAASASAGAGTHD